LGLGSFSLFFLREGGREGEREGERERDNDNDDTGWEAIEAGVDDRGWS
jgi:hypothetical protein